MDPVRQIEEGDWGLGYCMYHCPESIHFQSQTAFLVTPITTLFFPPSSHSAQPQPPAHTHQGQWASRVPWCKEPATCSIVTFCDSPKMPSAASTHSSGTRHQRCLWAKSWVFSWPNPQAASCSCKFSHCKLLASWLEFNICWAGCSSGVEHTQKIPVSISDTSRWCWGNIS